MKERRRIYYTDVQKALMWDRWQQGSPIRRIARSCCHNQQQIAEAVGVAQQTISDHVAEFTETGKFADSGIFGNFEGRQL